MAPDLRFFRSVSTTLLVLFLLLSPVFAQETKSPNYFAQQFYMRPDQKLLFQVKEVDGLLFVQTPNRERNVQYSVVTDFDQGAMKSRFIPGPKTSEELRQWIRGGLKEMEYEGVKIKALTLPESKQTVHIVGHKVFPTLEKAQAAVEQARAVIEAQGGNFGSMADEAARFFMPPPAEFSAKGGSASGGEKEEELILKYMDQLDIGNELFGPLQGSPSGESISWQSFAETSWRNTNLESENYMQQVGFWTNRGVFKGIKAPFNTIDPFVEATISLDSSGTDFKNNALFSAGLEWRPFARNVFLNNARLWGMPLLDFVKSYRFFIVYLDRKNIFDEIDGSPDHDWQSGASIFYEWGTDLPPINEGPPTVLPDYIRRYMWGEYFGVYSFSHTGFSTEDDFNAVGLSSSVILGVKLPGIPLPANSINNELVLMPYMRFEHTNNTEFSFPFQNRYLVAAGLRIMPFNSYQFKDNEWLAKTKLFFEYVGVGKVHHWKQPDDVPNDVDYDFRVGINVSSKRT